MITVRNKRHGQKWPAFLAKGDTVGIVAPAGRFEKEKIDRAIELIESWGLKAKCGKHMHHSFHQFSATDEERTADFQDMLDNEEIKAIFCARGGYGIIRIIDSLDFKKFIKKPKWIIGYSDITIFHLLLNQEFGICSIHATMPVNFPDHGAMNESLEYLKLVLFGEKPEYLIKPNKLNRYSKAKGILTGGNLSILCSLMGSNIEPDTRRKILFIEDVGEYLYHIDRMMIMLKRADKLKNLAGLIVGGMSEMKDNEIPFGKNAYEIVNEHIAEYNYPVCFGFPAGHEDKNLPLIMGAEIEMEISNEMSTVKYMNN